VLLSIDLMDSLLLDGRKSRGAQTGWLNEQHPSSAFNFDMFVNAIAPREDHL